MIAQHSQVRIRLAVESDAQGIHAPHMKSIVELCSKDYDECQIDAWGRRPFNRDQVIRNIANDHVWVVELNGKIEGFGHFKMYARDGHDFGVILGLYFTPEVKGQGLGRELVRPMGRPVTVQIGGVELPYIPMEKRL